MNKLGILSGLRERRKAHGNNVVVLYHTVSESEMGVRSRHLWAYIATGWYMGQFEAASKSEIGN